MEIRVMHVAGRYLSSVVGRLGPCYTGRSQPESRVYLMQCLPGAMMEGIRSVENGEE